MSPTRTEKVRLTVCALAFFVSCALPHFLMETLWPSPESDWSWGYFLFGFLLGCVAVTVNVISFTWLGWFRWALYGRWANGFDPCICTAEELALGVRFHGCRNPRHRIEA